LMNGSSSVRSVIPKKTAAYGRSVQDNRRRNYLMISTDVVAEVST